VDVKWKNVLNVGKHFWYASVENIFKKLTKISNLAGVIFNYWD
jgi:hypothetical protein